MGDGIVKALVGDEQTVVQVEVAGPVEREKDVSALDRALPFDGVVQSVAAVASAMTDALRRAKPEEAEVEFGIDIGLESGKLTSLLVKGSGTATLKVRLLWRGTQ